MATAGTVNVKCNLDPAAPQGFFVYVPASDELIAGAEHGGVVEELAEKYAGDAARALVKKRRFELLKKREENQ